MLIPRGQDSSGDQFPLFGAETLVNHGRNYYNNTKPFTVPYEYTWKPKFVYAPSAFTQGLFNAMKANSATGEFAKSANRQFLEGYNATRGVYRGTRRARRAELARPLRRRREGRGLDLRQLEGATSAGTTPPAARAPGRNPGYTVYILNTWDSAEARAILKPQNEYHVWKINRTDPDTGQFDGIDWARIWGGRYRFMMVDTGAAPNPYEAETWGNRNRSVFGSANYDPPLWEYRAKAPRPVTLVNIGEGIEQAVTPGRDLGRRPAQLHARPDREPGDLVPVPALVPLRAAAGHRPVLVLGQRLARREGGAAVGIRPEQALQPGASSWRGSGRWLRT